MVTKNEENAWKMFNDLQKKKTPIESVSPIRHPAAVDLYHQFQNQPNFNKNGRLIQRDVFLHFVNARSFVNKFYFLLFKEVSPNLTSATLETYIQIRHTKATLFKRNEKYVFNNLKMPAIMCCIFYCEFFFYKRPVPLSMLVVLVNKIVKSDLSFKSPISFDMVEKYRTDSRTIKYGLKTFFKLKKAECYSPNIDPEIFIPFASNLILHLSTDEQNNCKIICRHIKKELPESTPPSLIAMSSMFFIGQFKSSDEFGKQSNLHKQLIDIGKKIENSQNRYIRKIISENM